MFCKHALVAAALLLAGCSRAPRPVERIAILSFENLTDDASADWIGRGLAEVVAGQLISSPDYYVTPLQSLHGLDSAMGAHPAGVPGISAERPAALAIGADRIVYGTFSRHAGMLRVEASVEDIATRKIVRSMAAEAPEVFGAAAALARALDAKARPYPTRNAGALREYVTALTSGDAGAAARATAQDPGFGQAWILLAQLTVRTQGPAAATQVLEQAAQRGLAPQERVQVEHNLALLHGDPAGAARALTELTRVTPGDPGPYRTLSDIAVQEHQYAKAVSYLNTATARHPSDPALWNSLGYCYAYAGNLSQATAALERYRDLRPREPNPLDSLGDVHFYLGKFKEAGHYYEAAFDRDHRFLEGGSLLKAAWARLMQGDVGGANRRFERYMQGHAEDPLAGHRRAEWAWLTGRRREAIATLERSIPPNPELAARTHAQLAIWRLELGDATGARQAADRAVAAAPSLGVARVARFLTLPPAPSAEWALRAERELPAGAIKDYALACALLFGREFQAAAPLLRQVYQRWTPAGDQGIPILLAWAYLETGNVKEAAALLKTNPVPQSTGLNPFTSLHFPRLLFLRGEYPLFLKLSGPDGLIWGEERRAATTPQHQPNPS